MSGEGYIPPVGFASEPSNDRRRWIGRILLALFVFALGWMVFTRVLPNPTDERPVDSQTEQPLPAPR